MVQMHALNVMVVMRGGGEVGAGLTGGVKHEGRVKGWMACSPAAMMA